MAVLHLDAAGRHAIGSVGNVLVCVHRIQPSAEILEKAYAQGKALSASHPSGIGLLVVLELSASAPDEGAREVISRWKRDEKAAVRARVIIHEASGFGAAHLRAVALTLSRGVSLEPPDHVCSSVAEGAAWLASEMAVRGAAPLSRPELAEAVEKLRRRLTPPPTTQAP